VVVLLEVLLEFFWYYPTVVQRGLIEDFRLLYGRIPLSVFYGSQSPLFNGSPRVWFVQTLLFVWGFIGWAVVQANPPGMAGGVIFPWMARPSLAARVLG
jgi:hypothetical protein